jgi:hypothetical protein
MVHTAAELHNENIQSHQQAHLTGPHLAVDVLQAQHPDLSCLQCYFPRRTSPRSDFGRFWTWYQTNFEAQHYSSQTQDNFTVLTTPYPNRVTIRLCIRNIIFSCRYQQDLGDPRTIALTLVRRYTNLFQLPTIPFEYQNAFDLHLDTPLSFSFEEPGEFSRHLGNLGSPILPPTTDITYTDNIPFLRDPADSLAPYSELVTPTELSESHYTPDWTPQIPLLLTDNIETEEYITASVELTGTSSSDHTPTDSPQQTLEDSPPPSPPPQLTLPPQQPIVVQPQLIVAQPQPIQPQPIPVQFQPIAIQPQPELLPPLPPILNNLPNPPNNMADQALQDAAQAMTNLTNALNGTEKSLMKADFFYGDGTQDPEQWLEDFRRAAIANK